MTPSFFSSSIPQELREKHRILDYVVTGFYLYVFRKFPEFRACFLLYKSGFDQKKETTY